LLSPPKAEQRQRAGSGETRLLVKGLAVMSTEAEVTRDRPRDRRVALGVIAVVLGTIVTLAWFLLRSSSKKLIESLGLPEGATEVSDIDVSWADGTAPEMATRSFRVRGDEASLRRFYWERCQELGLSEPRPERARFQPVVCERPGLKETVVLNADCKEDMCSVFLEVHVLM
jgi:hypothetical protein